MSQAVFSDASIVVLGDGDFCQCKTGYRSDKGRLCDELFKNVPPAIDPDAQLPNIRIWKDGVEMVSAYDKGMDMFTFTVVEEEEGDPKKPDVILHGGRFYVIGEVQTVVDPHLEIEPETIWVYPDWAVDNEVFSNLNWNVK